MLDEPKLHTRDLKGPASTAACGKAFRRAWLTGAHRGAASNRSPHLPRARPSAPFLMRTRLIVAPRPNAMLIGHHGPRRGHSRSC
ncbi:hypothetical protein CWO89_08315 [Bradyrhizobium sp. Leo170]|nr:hypothetical protein CWO89_08315 [Bradyrhizobium sp. Leo170]